MRQIEKTDGAAIGALVNTQAELHFSNLLSAVRSGKYKSMDVKVSDDLGQVVERVRKGESISEQISKAFVQDAKAVVTEIVTDEQAQEAYDRQQLEEYRNVVQTAEKEVTALLKRGELPAGGDNLMAAEALLGETGDFFSGTGKKSGKPEKDRKKEPGRSIAGGNGQQRGVSGELSGTGKGNQRSIGGKSSGRGSFNNGGEGITAYP